MGGGGQSLLSLAAAAMWWRGSCHWRGDRVVTKVNYDEGSGGHEEECGPV
jgi:hypothetical protein